MRVSTSQNLITHRETSLDRWEKLTIQDRFLFSRVMSREENSLPLLRMLFPELDIDHIRLIEAEKTQEGAINSKGVRYDVYVRDSDERAFTLEMQVRNEQNLPQRSRYYASLMDEDLLQRGEVYEDMKESCIVFICPFDPFGYGLHR